MKLYTVAVLLLSAIGATELRSLEGNMNYIQQEGKINNVLKKDSDSDNHLAQLVTTALAGAPPGEIAEPSVVGATEGGLITTNGHTYKNYQYFWKYVCAFTKWIPTNQYLHSGQIYK